MSTFTEPKQIDVLDDHGNPTGKVLSRQEIHAQGKIHRAVHLYLFDKSNNLLLQRRSLNTDHYPGMFSISVTGHVDAGEDSREAVLRELKEELGIDRDNTNIEFLFSFRQDAEISPAYIDRQFNDVYAGWIDLRLEDISFDTNEVSEVKLVPFSEFETMVNDKSGDLAPVYEEECAKIVPLLKERI
ncbi:MAG: hypothetical protein COT84_02745 [Chlamydiae bacterium CG10_big_fil_rev_8_21_14_0_10_35_9]|nr:MAG: hypothetical protein COT84_02745 [Chlamydiae bacterium CG10_big_fil_rev_8_21_14_0_10_35_9]